MTNLLKLFLWFIFPSLVIACSSSGRPPEPEKIDYVSSVRQVGKLQLSEMSLSKVGRISDPAFQEARTLKEKAEAMVDKMKIGTRIGVYSYQTYLSAYIDLSELSPLTSSSIRWAIRSG